MYQNQIKWKCLVTNQLQVVIQENNKPKNSAKLMLVQENSFHISPSIRKNWMMNTVLSIYLPCEGILEEACRDRWKAPLLQKGVLTPADKWVLAPITESCKFIMGFWRNQVYDMMKLLKTGEVKLPGKGTTSLQDQTRQALLRNQSKLILFDSLLFGNKTTAIRRKKIVKCQGNSFNRIRRQRDENNLSWYPPAEDFFCKDSL